MDVKKVAKEYEIYNKKKEAAKSKEKTKKLVPQRFHKWIYIFGKKASEKMLMKKVWDHAIELNEEFVLRKEKVYPLSRKERRKVCKFIEEQLRKEYIKLSKLPQMALVFFIGKKDGKKYMVQDYQYLNKWTIKNNYPLLLISDIVENIGIKKYLLSWTYDGVIIMYK